MSFVSTIYVTVVEYLVVSHEIGRFCDNLSGHCRQTQVSVVVLVGFKNRLFLLCYLLSWNHKLNKL